MVTLAVWKFASCDGCQLSLLDCEDELLTVAEHVEVVYFPEATRTMKPGPYDVSLVEGSVTTPEEVERIHHIREQSSLVVTIGACATAGGIQGLRNYADVAEFTRIVYASPEFIDTLSTSTPIAAHVPVDFELRGCPINKHQLLEVLTALIHRRKPVVDTHSVCVECKLRGTPCVMVTRGVPCLGPVTQAGCDALCPSYTRGCFGCYGPMEALNVAALDAQWAALGVSVRDRIRALQTFNAASPAFRDAVEAIETS